MSNYQTLLLQPNFQFKLNYTQRELQLSDVDLSAVEAIWHREQELRKEKLFNGKVLSLLSYDETQLTASFVDYKLMVAYLRDPQLRQKLGIRPLSLSGVAHTDQAILIGKRSSLVSQYPGWYELAPSGGIDPIAAKGEFIDIKKQALIELEEETGIRAIHVVNVKPYALVLEKDSGIMEVCVDILIKSSRVGETLESTPEYADLFWIPFTDIQGFIQKHERNTIPLSIHLLTIFQ